MPPHVMFLESLEGVQADLLLLEDLALLSKIDSRLHSAIANNQKRLKLPFTMTTNGISSISQIALGRVKLSIHDTKVVLVISPQAVAQRAFEILRDNPTIETLIVLSEDKREDQRRFAFYSSILEGMALAKRLISAPANQMSPMTFAAECVMLQKQGISVEILNEKELMNAGLHALLAVGQGSINPPRLVILSWKGADEPPCALVGKGICYDSGGINLKTSYLNQMQRDKAGAGAVVGTILALALQQAPVHVIGILPLAENMPDGGSMRPGDVIETCAGKTVEVVDTDCEGRLVLADGISYAAQRFSPKKIIDLGTLTLETFGALGGEYAGLFCNDSTLERNLLQAGKDSGEKLWPLPLGSAYASQLSSKVADLKNLGIFRYGASSAAAEFLRVFVPPNTPWAHLDISGTAWDVYSPEKGVTAFGVHLLTTYLSQRKQ